MAFVKASWPAWTDETIDIAIRQHLIECIIRSGRFDLNIRGQFQRDFLRPSRRIHTTANPDDVGWFDAIADLENPADPDIRTQLILRDAYAFAFQVLRLVYAAIGANVD